MSGRVLVSGAGIAGPALAYWLQRFGFQATLVERAATLRPGGQAIDVRGAAVKVLKNMGLCEASNARRTQMRGGSALDADGNEIWRSEERSFSGGRFDSGDIELFRDDLVRLLYEAAQGAPEYLWDDSISALEQSADAVRVSFARGKSREFELLVGADGLHSNVRRLAFGDEAPYLQSFGIGLAIFSTPNLLQLQNWQFSHRDAVSGYIIYPNLDNSQLRVNLGFALQSPNAWRGDVATQKALVAESCAHMRWEIPRLIEAMWNCTDFYFGDVAQVKMPRWSGGRVVLLGDAAYCPSPFSGQGTSLALVGAYVLARELQRTPADPRAAFERYESRMRPYVDLNQALVDLTRVGPTPDDIMDTAKNGIELNEDSAKPA
jgi:2-polyprenyl-6-methoxyphenol hydroxylase-like FAD-dependent oxidoreductase